MIRFIERTASMGQVDRTAGIIRGVKLLGQVSRNGRRYTADAMAEAVGLYDGVKVFVGHPERDKLGEDRKFDDWVGVVTNPRFDRGGIFADVKLRTKSPRYEELLEAAESFDVCVGMSHVADGKCGSYGLEEVVESITEVFSVDIVLDPATVAGLFEGVANAGDRQTNRYSKSQRDAIAKLADDARRLRKSAVSRVAVANSVDVPKPMGDLLRDLVQFGSELTAWLGGLPTIQQRGPAAAARKLLQSLNEMFSSPLDGSPDAARAALDELVAFVDELAGRSAEGVTADEEFVSESWRRACGVPREMKRESSLHFARRFQ